MATKFKFKIEKNIPIPAAGGRGPRNEYPFEDMEVGESFFIPGMTVKKMNGQLTHYKKTLGMNISVRAVTEEALNDDGELEVMEGVRVWKREPKAMKARVTRTTDDLGEDEAAALAPAEADDNDYSEDAAPAKKSKKKKAAEAEADEGEGDY